MSHFHAGIDVSAKTLAVATDRPGRATCTFTNDREGHRKLVAWLAHKQSTVRVVIEPSGIYSLDLALALDAAPCIEVMVANPRRVAAFAKATTQRGKTDAMDADVLLLYCQRMPFTPWHRPAEGALALRQITRHVSRLVVQQTRLKNQLHAATSTNETPAVVIEDLQQELVNIGRRIETLRRAANEAVQADEALAAKFELLISIPGIGAVSALTILAELALLPEDMTARQWVAHAGLDPKPKQSGTSVLGQTRISRQGNKYLRHALFMPAMTASVHSPHVRAFCDRLQANGRTRLECIVAAMRKLLHAIYGMLRADLAWQGERFNALAA